jgi:alkylhydroperoxidase/carboxymuconolactone decarboxylase family protein YurZ
MSYLYTREHAKEMTKSELRGNYWSQSKTVQESYRSLDELYRSHSEGNSSYTAYMMREARGSTAEQYSSRRLG